MGIPISEKEALVVKLLQGDAASNIERLFGRVAQSLHLASRSSQHSLQDSLKPIIDGIEEAKRRANILSKKLESPDEDVQTLNAFLKENPFDAMTLLAFCTAERKGAEGVERRYADIVDALRPNAELGKKFKANAGPKKKGAVRIAVEKLLKKQPSLKNAEIWEKLSEKPPRGWSFCDSSSQGKYADGPRGEEMGFPRFRNICADVRKDLKDASSRPQTT